MDKRTETRSFRLTPELDRQLELIAIARDMTVSDLVYQHCLALAKEEHVRYLKLRQAFESMPDVPSASGFIQDSITGE